MKATIMEPTSTNAEFSVAHSRREKDSPPFSVNLSISGLIKEDCWLHHQMCCIPSLPQPWYEHAWSTREGGGAHTRPAHLRNFQQPSCDRDATCLVSVTPAGGQTSGPRDISC